MKTAIITWFENLNYGTALQAYSLQKYLSDNFNTNVSLIRYSPDSSQILKNSETAKEHFTYRLISKIKRIFFDSVKKYNDTVQNDCKREIRIKKDKFNDFLSQIEFTQTVKTDNDLEQIKDAFDLFICGSDQIWNPQILDKNYYLTFAKKKPKLAYAASFGINYLPEYSKKYIKDYLSDFRAVGLRENTVNGELSEICDKDIQVVCDPVFLLPIDSWNNFSKISTINEKSFTATYFLGDSKLHKKALNIFNNMFNEKNIIIPQTYYTVKKSEKENNSFGPCDFLYLIKNADYILTDSFHAVCFSIIFKKNFCVLYKHKKNNPFNQNNRINALLERLNLKDRIAENDKQVKNIIKTNIYYTGIEIELNEFINESKEFLNKYVY